MSSARCPACAAAVPVGAPWCTLCFADLRPRPEPVSASVAGPAAAVQTLDAPVLPAQEPPPAEVLPPHPILDAPVHAARPLAGNRAAAWPCTGCGAAVPIEEMECPSCGAGFLAPERSRASLVLPVIGDVAQLSQSGRVMLMAGGCLAVTLVLFVVFVLLGGLV